MKSTDAYLIKLAGEAELNPSVMGALDGNNSLKRFVRDDRRSDTLVFESDYFLSQEYVDRFKDEVKRKVRKPDDSVVYTLSWPIVTKANTPSG